jgi:hypothetical protein
MPSKKKVSWKGIAAIGGGVLVLAALASPKNKPETVIPAPPAAIVATVALPSRMATLAPVGTQEPVALEPADLASPMPKVPSTTPVITASLATDTPAPSLAPASVASGNANLRDGPGTGYPVVGTVKAGQALAIIGCNPEKTWYELDSWSWIVGDLVQNGSCPAIVQGISPPPAARAPQLASTAVPVAAPALTAAPAYSGPPGCQGATGARYGALCGDNTTSGATGSGACSHHGGVKTWLTCP